jgi:biopolymer transport protein ExbB
VISRDVVAAALACSLLLAVSAHAEQPEQQAVTQTESETDTQPKAKAESLEQLLQQIREGSRIEEQENQAREAEFRSAQSKQKQMLAAALADEAREQKRASELEKQFEGNENALSELQETLKNRLGTLGELFGVVRQTAGDARSRVENSIISAQLPGRDKFLSKLAQSRELPSIDDLRKLWLTLQEEMTEQGRVVAFKAPVIEVGGKEVEREVVRIGPFNAISNGAYLQYLPDNGKLAELARQPASRYLNTAASFENAHEGLQRVAIDPTRGTILSMLIQAPDFEERVQQGGTIGYVTIVLGAIGLLVALYRLVGLGIAGRKIRGQEAQSEARKDNALGRILAVYQANRATDVETLELRLDEAILKETSGLQRGATLVKVLSVVAPLLGLLGTVTGMILTFQQITLFGTGDPKVMAGGISQALVTTVIGLVVAIPLTLLHSLISDRSRTLVQILEEHSVGMVAEQAEGLTSKAA